MRLVCIEEPAIEQEKNNGAGGIWQDAVLAGRGTVQESRHKPQAQCSNIGRRYRTIIPKRFVIVYGMVPGVHPEAGQRPNLRDIGRVLCERKNLRIRKEVVWDWPDFTHPAFESHGRFSNCRGLGTMLANETF